MSEEIVRLIFCDHKCLRETEHECYRDPPSFPQAKFVRCKVCKNERQISMIEGYIDDYSW